MDMIVHCTVQVKIEGDRTNANEIFEAMVRASKEWNGELALTVVEGCQERIVEVLCSPSGMAAKKGLGSHEKKGGQGQRCRHRQGWQKYWRERMKPQGRCEIAIVAC